MFAEDVQSDSKSTTILKLWTPGVIGFMTFFLGFPSGITLASINWIRMGMKGKAFAHIAGGLVGILALILFPDNLAQLLGLVINIGYMTYLRQQMKYDIATMTAANVQYAHWSSGFVISLISLGIIVLVGFGVAYVYAFFEGLSPATAQYHANRGDDYSNNGDYDRAIAEYTKAIELETNQDRHAIQYYYRGLAFQDKGDVQNAISDFSQVIKIKPNESRAFFARGGIYLSNENYEFAVADFTQVIRIDPKYADAYYNRGLAFQYEGDFQNAISDFSQVVKINPNDGEAYFERGLNYALNGDYELSVDDFTQAIKLNSEDAYSYFNRGLSYENLNLNDMAIKDFERVLELTSDSNLRTGAQAELLKLRGR
ncbi:MAG TPA: tetratricopeptide repeat protein [Anaerolineales bacterium]|nr:tetratricopeptide repeat protein [Anaerolineales bacterium]